MLAFKNFQAKPELARLSSDAPDGLNWLHELKYDGYRVLAYVKDGKVSLKSRNDLEWRSRFPEIARLLSEIPARSFVIDGEVTVLTQDGVSNFSKLQRHIHEQRNRGFTYFAFDLLYLNGTDLRETPLLVRKKLLESLIPHNSKVRFAPHIVSNGAKFYQAACRRKLEGVISKRIDSFYQGGRSGDWVKTKCRLQDEFIIGGFTEPQGKRTGFGALLLGYYRRGTLVYCGRVGSGFNSLGRLFSILSKSQIDESPFSNGLNRKESRGVHFLKPEYFAQIKYTGWGSHGKLRHPVFLGLRDDKSSFEVNRAA